MKQPAAQQQVSTQSNEIPLRDLSIHEVVAMALHKRRTSGKESRRVVLFLKPSLIPPSTGQYETALGPVKVFSMFLMEQGKWLLEVKLPNESGFPLRDHTPSQPSDTQK